MRRLLISILVFGGVVAGVVWITHPRTGEPFQYSSSPSCESCHEENYQAWSQTLHPKMFFPVTSDTDILGDFSVDDPVLTFAKSDVEYVVGSRWEQVYARMIDGEYYPLPARWLVKQQKWAAYRVDSWQDTPMSVKCNGCHTTGFNPDTYEFTEFGIGCEACHGPGRTHVLNRRETAVWYCRLCHQVPEVPAQDIVRSVSSTVCGQCHSRGKSVPNSEAGETVFSFPIQVTPGDNLAAVFDPSTPETDQGNKYWWGNGVAKARHQEFADWEKSDHANALRRMKERHKGRAGELAPACLGCHSTDYRLSAEENRPTLETAQYGTTCVGCHDPHLLAFPEDEDGRSIMPCKDCHNGAVACTATREPCTQPCPTKQVGCVDCHMPYVVKSGGWLSIRGHAFKVISPLDTAGLDMPNSCQNGSCHQDRNAEWIRRAFLENYGGK